MNDTDLQKIRETVADSIENNVNGKIKVLTQEFRDYVKTDTEWKERAQPYIDGLANVTGGTKIFIYIVMGIGAVAGAILSIKSFFIK